MCHHFTCLFAKLVCCYVKEIQDIRRRLDLFSRGVNNISLLMLLLLLLLFLGVKILTMQGELNVTSVDTVSINYFPHKTRAKNHILCSAPKIRAKTEESRQ